MTDRVIRTVVPPEVVAEELEKLERLHRRNEARQAAERARQKRELAALADEPQHAHAGNGRSRLLTGEKPARR